MPKVMHWGDMITLDNENFTPDVTADIERSMSKFSLAIYKFDSDEDASKRVENIKLPPPDPLVMYAISLHKHINDVTEMIRVAELAAELNLIPPEDAIPKVAAIPDIPVLHAANQLNYIPNEFTPFSTGKEVEMPELNETVVKQILSKSVAILLAHIGYETTHQSVLDLMTDVLESFYKKFCHHLKVAVEDSEQSRLGFPHVTEKVLTELGLGGASGLHDYYQSRVVKYIDVLLKRCQEVSESYRLLLVPKCPSPVDEKIFSVKVEDDDITEDNLEVHFSTLEGGELGFTSLQTGYQLLNTLEAGEAEVNLQNLIETEDDMAVSTPPGAVGTTAEAEHTPFAKKKKFK